MIRSIEEIQSSLGLRPEELEPYGRNKAKVRLDTLKRLQGAPDGRLVLVTAINPTPAGEGKTVTTIGLGDALASLGKRTIVNIREPSLGPVFGVKGGGAGGGMARAVPGEELNLHFTGDFHAITAAHNLLAALLDAHVFHGNQLGFGPHGVAWQRVLDVTDRSLRSVVTGLGGSINGTPREASFAITAASEVMATVAASRSLEGLSERLARLVIGTRTDGTPITAGELGAVPSMVLLLRDAMNPNLIQTAAGTPLFAHTGPFGNLATGHNSVASDEMALKLADIVVTEAGFGSDLGFEKFCHLVAPALGRSPSAVVVVATVRALKSNSALVPRLVPGKPLPKELEDENLPALADGAANLKRHVENVRQFGLPVVVAVNRFPSDSKAELEMLESLAKSFGASACAVSEVFAKGGAEGGRALGEAVLSVLESEKPSFKPLYSLDMKLEAKLDTVVKKVYGGAGISFKGSAKKKLGELEKRGFGNLPLCVAKTPFSLSHDPKLRGAPTGFQFEVDDVDVAAAAGFVRVFSGGIMVMPGFGAHPSALDVSFDADGTVRGLKI